MPPETAPPDDPTLIGRFKLWQLAGESMPRLALHIHADHAAKRNSEQIIEAVGKLKSGDEFLSLGQLDEAVKAIAEPMGLTARASNRRCGPDPLETVVDLSFYEPGSNPR